MKTILISILLFIILFAGGYAQSYPPPGKYFFVLNFNQAMDTVSLKKFSSYKVFDQDMNELPVLNIATMYHEDSFEIVDSMITLLVDAPNYKTTYMVRVDSVYSKEGELISEDGNSAWYYFDGYDSEANRPETFIKKK